MGGPGNTLYIKANEQNIKEIRKLEPVPRDLEIQLAFSALPLHFRDNATVYVLNPQKEKPDLDPLRRQSAFVRS